MTTSCIFICSEKEKKDIRKFENEVRTVLNPSKNKLCVCFQHNVTDTELNSFDATLKKKKPALVIFSGVSISKIEKLASRARKRFPNLKVLSDATTESTRVQMKHIQNLSYELIASHLTPTQELAVAV